VYDKRFKTDKGIGVSSTLGDVRKSYPVDWIASEEDGVFARVEAMGMSFALDNESSNAIGLLGEIEEVKHVEGI
jgi:hypothetical protein